MTDFSITCAVVTFTVKVICFTLVHGIRHSTLVTDLCYSVFPCVTLCYPVLPCGVTLCDPVVLPCVTLCYPLVLHCGVTLCDPVVLPCVTLWCYPELPCGVTLCLPCVPLCSPVNLVAMVLVVCQLSCDVIGYDNNKTMASNE